MTAAAISTTATIGSREPVPRRPRAARSRFRRPPACVAAAERVDDDERGEQLGASRATTPVTRGGRSRPPSATGPAALIGDRADREQADRDPGRRHRCRQPQQGGRRGGDDGDARRRERHQAERDRRAEQRARPTSSGRHLLDEQREVEGGEHRVEPERRAGRRAATPPRAPIAVPIHQPAPAGSSRPIISSRSNVPSPRLAIAHEASTIVWPSAARRSGPP